MSTSLRTKRKPVPSYIHKYVMYVCHYILLKDVVYWKSGAIMKFYDRRDLKIGIKFTELIVFTHFPIVYSFRY